MSDIKQAKTTNASPDSAPFPLVQVAYLVDRVSDAAMAYPDGHHGNPKTGTPCLLINIAGDEGNQYVIPLSAKNRPKGLKETEQIFGNFEIESTIFFDEEGNIVVTSVKDLIADITGNVTATVGGNVSATISGTLTANVTGNTTLTTPLLTINGNVQVNGQINSTGDQIAGTISQKTHLHGGVTTGGSNTGVPV